MEVSDYEKRRLENIDKNNKYLTDIGLGNAVVKQSARKASKIRKSEVQPEVPTRRSSRNEGKLVNYHEPVVELSSKRIKMSSIVEDDETPVVVSIKGEFIAPVDIAEPNSARTFSSSSNSSSQLTANVDTFLSEYLCKPVPDYGKAAVMSLANYGHLPKFNKYNGVVEWENAVFLWVNIGGQCGYHNAFTEKGRYMMWYGGSRMRADSPITLRMLKAGDMTNKIKSEDNILLFVRLEGENYCCLGKVGIVGYNLSVHPIQLQLELLNYDSICTLNQFAVIQKNSK